MPDSMLPDQLEAALSRLNGTAQPPWQLVHNKLHKTFVFRDFVEAFAFMTAAAMQAEKMNHHPEWSNVYKTVVVDLTTHEASGVTEKDFKLAEIFEALARA